MAMPPYAKRLPELADLELVMVLRPRWAVYSFPVSCWHGETTRRTSDDLLS
jgi:hypothetical protein